jgi:hypothetical protein
MPYALDVSRKRRRTKHRGNAAGIVETRGRTGRRPTAAERKADAKTSARQARLDRLNRPPTWRSAANRALVATLLFVVVIVAAFGRPISEALALAGFLLLLYIPLGYYTDLFMYRRRQAKKLNEGKG